MGKGRQGIIILLVLLLFLATCVKSNIPIRVILKESFGPPVCEQIKTTYQLHRFLEAESKRFGVFQTRRRIQPYLNESAKRLILRVSSISSDVAVQGSTDVKCGYWIGIEKTVMVYGQFRYMHQTIYEAWVSLSHETNKYSLEQVCIGADQLERSSRAASDALFEKGLVPSQHELLNEYQRFLPTCFTTDGEYDGYLHN